MLTIEINDNLNLVNLTRDENGRKYSKMCSTNDFYDKMYEILAPYHDQHLNYKLPYGVIEFHTGSEIDTFKMFLPREVRPIKFSLLADSEYKDDIDTFLNLNGISFVCEIDDYYIDDDDNEVPYKHLYTITTDAFYPDRFYTINLIKDDVKQYSSITVYNYCNTLALNGVETGNRFLIPYGNIYDNHSICLGEGEEEILSLLNSKIKNNDYFVISSVPRMIEGFINNFDLLKVNFNSDYFDILDEKLSSFDLVRNSPYYQEFCVVGLANYSAALANTGKVESAIELLYNCSEKI